tara:strand:- start:421 stop:1599 length:1179 start_codon:yes stop_codon:yes gene_type:complete
MNITLKRTDEQVALVKAMASKNRETAYEAQAAVAEFMGPILAEVVNNAPGLSGLFTSLSFDHEDNPSIPLDLYYDVTDEDYITIWSQNVPGGLPTNTVQPTQSELKFTTYRLDSAVEFDKKYAQRSRLDVVSKSMTRLAQEVLLKQERTSANLIMGSLAKAKTNSKSHILSSAADGELGLADFNNLLAHAKRIHASWAGGTPTSRSRGVTDIICSPEVVAGLRALAFNPVYKNNKTGEATAYPATDEMRSEFYNAAGVPDIYGISITELNEMGVGQRYNNVFGAIQGRNSRFDEAKDEIVLGIDRGSESLIRGVAVDADYGSEFQLLVDDQYSVRQSKIGYYGAIEEGRMVLDDRALTGFVLCGGATGVTEWDGSCATTVGESGSAVPTPTY